MVQYVLVYSQSSRKTYIYLQKFCGLKRLVQLRNFTFLQSFGGRQPYFYQDVVYWTMTLKLDSQVRRWLCHKLCEDRLKLLGRSTLFRILQVREASPPSPPHPKEIPWRTGQHSCRRCLSVWKFFQDIRWLERLWTVTVIISIQNCPH